MLLFLFSLAALLVPAPLQKADATADFRIHQDLVDQLAAQVVPLVRKELGVRFPDGIPVRLASTEEIAAALEKENLPIFRTLLGDSKQAETQATQFAAMLAPALLAKYPLGGREVLVSPGAFTRLAERIGIPELNSKAALRAVLVHELVHAAADELYDLKSVFASRTSADQVEAFNAVIEGHAQHVARRICAANGWSRGFGIYDRSISAPPVLGDSEGGAGMDLLLRQQAELFAWLYHDGERFIAALEAAGGPAAVARAYREPPRDSAVIFEPGWFLHPETRPKLAFDFEGALDAFVKDYPEKEWSATRTGISKAQLRTALSLLPSETVERVLRGLRNVRVISITPSNAPGSRLVSLVLYEFGSPADAAFFLAADDRLMRIKDAKMTEGAIRILDSSYGRLEEEGASGLIAEKTVSFQGQKIPVLTVVAVRGRLGAELVFSNQKASRARATRAILDALHGVRTLAPPAGSAPSGTIEKPPGPPEYGLYRMYWSRGGYGSRLASWTREFRTPPHFVMFYRDLGRLAFPRSGIEGIRSIGAVPIISLELWNWGDSKTSYLPRILAGEYDEALRGWAAAAAAAGGRILLRFGFECNGDWFSWSGDPPAYVAAWHHAHEIFEKAGAENVEWVWSPNAVSIPRTKENAMFLYYPGDDVVDWVGLDGYNFGDDHDRWHTWESFERVFDGPLAEFRKRYPDKPVIIAETGAASDDRKAEWIHGAWDYLATRPEVRVVVWFDLDKRREGEPDWRIGSSPGALEAFNETFAAARPEKDENAAASGGSRPIIGPRPPRETQENESPK